MIGILFLIDVMLMKTNVALHFPNFHRPPIFKTSFRFSNAVNTDLKWYTGETRLQAVVVSQDATNVVNDSPREGSSETEPILNESKSVEGCSSTFEIRSDCSIAVETPDSNESNSLVTPDQPQCRICLDTEGEDLIAPCHCRGTQKYVHRSCLDNWRSTREGFAFSHCTECRAVFILRANVPPDRWWLRLKFQLLVARDHAFIFIIVQLIVAFLGVLVYKFYGDELREMFGYEEHPYGFYTMAVLAIVLVGLLYGFFIAIICGQRINERHYHILAKQELTKEYIVEDREVNNDAVELDPNHVTELRMLGLY